MLRPPAKMLRGIYVLRITACTNSFSLELRVKIKGMKEGHLKKKTIVTTQLSKGSSCITNSLTVQQQHYCISGSILCKPIPDYDPLQSEFLTPTSFLGVL